MAEPALHPDALTLLREQHLEVAGLFDRLERLQPVAQGSDQAFLEQRRQLTELIVNKLMVHSGIEEEIFYPALAEYADDGARLAEAAVEQHSKAERDASLVDGISPDNVDFDANVRELMHDVRAHVHMEETEIFPRIEAALAPAQLAELGERLAKAMKHAPTRPHPHTPPATSGLGRTLARGAAVVDRLRDAATNRERG